MSAVLVVKSKGGLFPHTHCLDIPRSAIANPPKDGLTIDTSQEYSLIFKHKHQVKISYQNLMDIQSGKEVVVFDTDKMRHSFAIGLKP